MAGFAAIPQKTLYSATKSAVIFFSYALRHQLRPQKIYVSCLAPGPIFTKPEIEKDTQEKPGWIGVKMAVAPEKVGEVAIKKTFRKKAMIIPGFLSSVSATLIRILPRRLVTDIYANL